MRPVESAAVPESCTCPECFFFLFCFLSKKKKAAAFLCLILCCRSGILSEAIKYDERKKMPVLFFFFPLFFMDGEDGDFYEMAISVSRIPYIQSRGTMIKQTLSLLQYKSIETCSGNRRRAPSSLDDHEDEVKYLTLWSYQLM